MAPVGNVDDDNISHRIFIGTVATAVSATIAVLLRFLSRHTSKAGYWWDDYTIAISLVFNWATAALRWAQVILYQFGRHVEYVSVDSLQGYQKSFLAIEFLYFSNAVLTKSSLLLLYHRIFGVVTRFRWVLWVSGVLVASYFVSCVVVAVAGCSPVSYLWDRNQPGSYIDEVNFFRWNGIGNMFLDFLVLCLPFPILWRMKLNLRHKLILFGIFLLGGFVCVMSVLRIVSFNRQNRNDITYTTVQTAMWSSIEQSVGIVCSCLPTLRPLFKRVYGGSQVTPKKGSGSDFGTQTQRLSIPSSRRESERIQLDSAIELTAWSLDQTMSLPSIMEASHSAERVNYSIEERRRHSTMV